MPLFISEFSSHRNARDGMDPLVIQPALVDQVVAIGAASVQSNVFNVATDIVRISSDVICSVKFGTTPTATATSMRLAPNIAEYFSVPAGQSIRLAAITNT